jgi:hypothetical protein
MTAYTTDSDDIDLQLCMIFRVSELKQTPELAAYKAVFNGYVQAQFKVKRLKFSIGIKERIVERWGREANMTHEQLVQWREQVVRLFSSHSGHKELTTSAPSYQTLR